MAQQFQGITYTVDIVMCIDVTGSMGAHIDRVKKNALNFHNDVIRSCTEKGKKISNLRVKVIAFRDYHAEDVEPMKISPFFDLPGEEEQLKVFVSPLTAEGGGDEPECALEALSYALQSDWAKEGTKRRQVVVMFTDTSAHPLEYTGKKGNYPSGLPSSIGELFSQWQGQSPLVHSSYKRLILFAPDCEPWTWISAHWDNTIHHPAQAGMGLSDTDYEVILDVIQNSI